jgi:hypothetical protein
VKLIVNSEAERKGCASVAILAFWPLPFSQWLKGKGQRVKTAAIRFAFGLR